MTTTLEKITGQKFLEQERKLVAEEAFSNYSFGSDARLSSSENWEYALSSMMWERRAQINIKLSSEKEECVRITFRVWFESAASASLREVYCSSFLMGDEIGKIIPYESKFIEKENSS